MSLAQETRTSTFPYPGLRPYDQSEADLFFGREEHVDQLLGKLEVHRFLAVIGPSGCGKSSLVRAGLLPALETGFMASAGIRWRSAVLRPESEPLRNLAKALLDAQALGRQSEDLREELGFLAATLRRGPLGLVEAVRAANLPERTNLLVLVDQFEELFRFHRLGGTSESNAFVDLLLASAIEPSESIYVVLTMRSDYLGNCPVFRGLPEAMNESQFLTPRLTREQNRAAIVGPAAMFGVKVEPEVVTRILNEMGTDPDQLPLMQHLLMRMWRRATQGRTESDYGGQVTLTMDDYEKVGGLANALSTHVERIYQELPDGRSRKIAEAAFRNLTEITPDGQVNRRPVKVSEISEIAEASINEIADVLDQFRQEGRSFLMPPISTSLTQESVIDISHESLIRQWRRLKDWTREEDKARQTARSVNGDLRAWKEKCQNEQGLLHGLRLLEAEEWAKTHPHQVQPEERDFVKASRDQLDREARRRRVVSGVFGAVAVFLVFAVIYIFQELRQTIKATQRAVAAKQNAEAVATNEKERAQKEADRRINLLRQTLETKAQALAGESRRILRQDPAGALTLAVQAKRMTEEKNFPTPKEVERALLSVLGSQRIVPPLSPLFPPSAQKITAVAFSPDGHWLVTGGFGSAAQLWRFEPDAHREPGAHLTPVDLDGHTESVDMVAVTSGDPHVATLDHEGVVRLWGLKRFNQDLPRVLLISATGKFGVIAMSDAGHWLAAGGKDGEAVLWSLKNPDHSDPPLRLSGHTTEILSLAFDSKGNWLATADQAGLVQLWNLTASPASPRSLGSPGPSKGVYGLAFSPDGRRLAATDFGGSIRLWNLGEGGASDSVVFHSEGSWPVSVAFSADARRLATSDNAGIIRFWEASASEGATPLQGVGGQGPSVGKLAFSSGVGRWLGAMDFRGKVWLWDVAGEYPAFISLRDATAPWGRATADGESAITAPRLPAQVSGFAFHPDGQSLVTIGAKGGVLLWDLSKLETTTPFDPFSSKASASDWPHTLLGQSSGSTTEDSTGQSSDRSSRLWTADQATTSASVVLLVWKPLHSTSVRKIPLASGAFSPDGRTVALPGPDGSIKLWDATAPLGSATRMLPGHPGHRISALAFSPAVPGRRRWLASGAKMRSVHKNAGTVSLWDLDVRNPTAPAAELRDHEGEILSLAFSPDGRWLITGAGGPSRLWDLKNGLPSKPTVVLGKPGVPTRALAFHPTATDWVAVGGGNGEILLWKLSNDPVKDSPILLSPHSGPISPHSGPITRLAFTADGKELISTSEDGTARRWSFDQHDPRSRFVELARHPGIITCLAISHDADRRWIATGGTSGEVRICRLDGEASESYPVPMDGYRGTIVDLAFSGDGRSLAISCEDKSVRVVTIDDTGHAPDSPILLRDEDETSTLLGLDTNGRMLIAAGQHGTARVWPLRWMPGLDQLAAQLAERNLSHDEWERHFPKEDYRKTFDILPIPESLFDFARGLAKQGQRDEALRRLSQLKAIDGNLSLDPKAEVDRSAAEGKIGRGRRLARNGEKDQAIEQFLAACKLVPKIVLDPKKEANKYEAMGLISFVDGLIETNHNTVIKPEAQGKVNTTHAEETAGFLNPLDVAQSRLEEAAKLNQQGGLGLDVQIERTKRRLSASNHDKKARQIAAEGMIDKAVAEFKEAVNLAPELFSYAPDATARQVASASPKRAVKQPVPPHADVEDERGRDLAAQGRTKEAVEAFRRAHELMPKIYAYDPIEEAKQAAANANFTKADRLFVEVLGLVQAHQSEQARQKLKEAKALDPSVARTLKDFEDRNSARSLVEEGKKKAREHDLQGAMAKFRNAMQLNPDLELDPEQLAWRHEATADLDKARRLAVSAPNDAKITLKKGLALIARLSIQEPGRSLGDDLEKLLRLYPVLSAARINLDPSSNPTIRGLLLKGFIDETRSVYERACVFDPLLEVPARFWNSLSWYAAIRGEEEAKRFKFASDLALASDPANTDFRDTRGLVRAMLGDRVGAIKDFEAYLWDCQAPRVRRERKAFIALLRSETPIAKIFTKEVRERIKGE